MDSTLNQKEPRNYSPSVTNSCLTKNNKIQAEQGRPHCCEEMALLSGWRLIEPAIAAMVEQAQGLTRRFPCPGLRQPTQPWWNPWVSCCHQLLEGTHSGAQTDNFVDDPAPSALNPHSMSLQNPLPCVPTNHSVGSKEAREKATLLSVNH